MGEAEASTFNLFTLFGILIFQLCMSLLENSSSLLSVLVQASLNGGNSGKWVFKVFSF